VERSAIEEAEGCWAGDESQGGGLEDLVFVHAFQYLVAEKRSMPCSMRILISCPCSDLDMRI